MPLTVDVISDVICPWCYIGKRRLEKAVAALAGRERVRVRWHPFQLNPHMPKGGVSRKEYRTAKFGSWERSLDLDAQVAEAGRAEGIPFDFDRVMRTPNTLDAHRLIGLADTEGIQDAVVEAVFRAYFTEGRDISRTGCPSRRGGRGRAGPGTGRDLLERRRGLGGDPGGGRTGPPCRGAGRAVTSSSTARSPCPGRREPSAFLAAFEQAAGYVATDEESVCKIGPGGEPSC